MSDRTVPSYLVRVFLNNCRVEGYTPKTLTWHTTALGKLTAYLESSGIQDTRDVTRDDLREYVTRLQASPGRSGPLSAHSVATYVRSMRAFFAWLTEEGYLPENPAKRVREPKAGEHNVTVLSLTDIRALLDACEGEHGARDRAVILTLYDTGIRASELCTAKLEDWSESPATLRVFGKGRKFRTVPLGRAATRALRRYVLARRDDSPYLFVGRSAAPLTPNGLLQALMRRGRFAGVHANPHLFRHTFAVTYLRNGGDVLTLQRILGHTSLDMVRHYAKLADDDVIERHRHHSPADRV